MSPNGTHPQGTAGSGAPSGSPVVAPTMGILSSQVTFNNTGGAIISVGPVASTASNVEVFWGSASVYSSPTPNLPGQFAIAATATSGSSYVLKLKLLYPGWTRPDVYTTTYVASPGTTVSYSLGFLPPGGGP
jgi:hypothetical protein